MSLARVRLRHSFNFLLTLVLYGSLSLASVSSGIKGLISLTRARLRYSFVFNTWNYRGVSLLLLCLLVPTD